MKSFIIICFCLLSNFVFSQSESGAMIVSEAYVKSVLNYPSTAKFKSFSQIVEKEGWDTYIVLGKVSATNAFGVKSDMVYKIWLKYKSGDDTKKSSWICPKLILEEEGSGKQHVFRPSSANTTNSSSNSSNSKVKFLGVDCEILESGPLFVRILTPKKYSKTDLEKGMKDFIYSNKIVYFNTGSKKGRGQEYASSVRGEILYF